MDGHTVEETHTMCMYVNMDDDLLVRFHLFLVLLVPSFSYPIGDSVLSIPSQNKKDTIDPIHVNGG